MWFLTLVCLIGVSQVQGQCDAATRPLLVDTAPTVIQSPDFDGSTPYADNLLCEWIVQSTEDVRFLLSGLGLEDCIDCACDSLSLYNGADDTAPLINTVCGGDLDILPLEVVGDSQMFIRFQTDTGNTGSVIGFSAAVTFVDAACGTDSGKNLFGPTGTVTSPNFPSPYPTSVDCQWNFRASVGQLVEFEFNALDIQDGCGAGLGEGLVFDYLQFVESDARTSLGRWFGNQFVEGFKFRNYEGNTPYLQFWSDSSEPAQGFNLTYNFV